MVKNNTTYTKEQVDEILNEIKQLVKNDNFNVSLNDKRKDNQEFINEFYLTHEKIKKILLSIETDDFCYSTQNTHKGYEHEILYIFVPKVTLRNIDDEEITIQVYTKFNIIKYKHTIVISLHKLKHPIEYLFK